MKEKDIDPRLRDMGARLRKIRIEKGYSNADLLAYEIKMSRTQYLRLEQGTNFTMSSLLRVLDALNVTYRDFFTS